MSPSAVGRSKPKRETMLSRAGRIIGKRLQDDSQEDEQASEIPSTQDSSSKRRSQVLKAQRAHRRRTQNYILELENEVLRLRKREAEMTAELNLHRSHSSNGRDTLSIGSPSTNSDGGTLLESHARTTPEVTIDLSDYAHVEAGYPCSKAALGFEPSIPIQEANNLTMTDLAIEDTNYLANDSFSTDAQSAIDFILDLERPCLSHIKFDLTAKLPTPFEGTNFNYGRSHSCTASAKIIQSCPNTDWASQKVQLPQQVVENLLKNSRSLPLGPEMTPVQVWQLLTDIGNSQNVSMAKISFFKGELQKYMRCNAFGTSIPIEFLQRLLSFYFPSYDATYLHDVQVPIAKPEVSIMNELIGNDWNQFY